MKFLDGWPNRFALANYADALFSAAYDAYVFAVNNNNVMSMPAPMDLYSLAIWDNSVLVRNFVPCRRREDGKVGLYDTVGQRFYTNANSNGEDFIPGPQRYPDGVVVVIR